jgi:mRNA interferase RelE/StbE
MPVCGYKKIFLKDLAAIPRRYRARIERLVFDQIPVSENIFHDFDIQKRMRNIIAFVPDSTGSGVRFESDNEIIFYRVKSREEIYRVFP